MVYLLLGFSIKLKNCSNFPLIDLKYQIDRWRFIDIHCSRSTKMVFYHCLAASASWVQQSGWKIKLMPSYIYSFWLLNIKLCVVLARDCMRVHLSPALLLCWDCLLWTKRQNYLSFYWCSFSDSIALALNLLHCQTHCTSQSEVAEGLE